MSPKVSPHSSTPTVLLLAYVAIWTAACTGQPASKTQEFIDCISPQVVSVENPDGSFPPAALDAFRAAIGDARLVGLGESRHDTREQLQMKAFMLRHLIEDLGFRVLILEESFSHAERLNRYITRGDGEAQEVLSRLAGWYLWDTEEMLDLVRWLHDYNQGRTPDEQVQVFGMDITAPAEGVQIVLHQLEAAGINSGVTSDLLGLDLQEGDYWPATWERYGAQSEERRDEIAEGYDLLLKRLYMERDRLVSLSSGQEYERLVLLAEIGQAGNALFSSVDRAAGGVIREQEMAGLVDWILDDAMPTAKAVMWAHNLHVAKSAFRMSGLAEGELHPIGVILDETYGENYVAIGATFGKGFYPDSLPPGQRTFELQSATSMDGAMARIGEANVLVDLRVLAHCNGATEWLSKERNWTAQDADATLVPGTAFDLVYFVQSISRSQPTSEALRKFWEMRGG